MSTGAADALAHSFRAQTLKTGTWPTMFVCLSLGIYLALTPDDPNRPLLGGLGVATLLASVIVLRAPLEQIVRGRWCEPFFVGWSTTLIALVAVACWADGGAGTPLESPFFLPLTFAALSYPLKSMLLVGAVNVGAYLLVAGLSPDASAAHVFLFASSLTAAAWVCVAEPQPRPPSPPARPDLAHRPAHRLPQPARLPGVLRAIPGARAPDGRTGHAVARRPRPLQVGPDTES